MLSEGTDMKYGIICVSVLFFRFKERTLIAMLELSDPDRKSTRPTHVPTASLEAIGPLHLVLASSNRLCKGKDQLQETISVDLCWFVVLLRCMPK